MDENFSREYVEIPYDEIPDFELIGQPEYLLNIYEHGIRNPVLLATWNGEMTVIGGNRRILSLKAAHVKAEADGTLSARPHLHFLKALIYHDVPPLLQTVWSLADNEERSDNPLHAYLTIKAAQDAGNWEKVNELLKLNRNRKAQIMEFGKLTPKLLEAVVAGQMAKTVAAQAAKLGAHQAFLERVIDTKAGEDKPVRITMTDVKQVKTVRSTAVLQTMAEQLTSAEPRKVVAAKVYMLVITPELQQELEEKGLLFEGTELVKAIEVATLNGGQLFRLSPQRG